MYTAMIAEDEVLVRLGLSVSIDWEALGIRLVADASDGLEALEAYQRYRPDIVITDIHMPGMDGLQLIRRIREGGRTLRGHRPHRPDRFRAAAGGHEAGCRHLPDQGHPDPE